MGRRTGPGARETGARGRRIRYGELSGVAFRDVFEASPDAMVLVDGDGKIVLVNAGVERLFGYRRAELLAKPVEVLIPDRFRERHVGCHAAFVANPQTRPMVGDRDLSGRRKDGSEFPVEIALSPLKTGNGLLVFAAIRDVGHLKLAERLASQARAVIESSHDAIIGTDLEGVVTSWNAGAERLYGYTAEEAAGRSTSILLPSRRGEAVAAVLRRVGAGERVDDYETVLVRKDGTPVDVSLTVSPIRDRSGYVIGASTIARDITTRVRRQEQLLFLAEHDPLTGVCNRRRFERDVSEQLRRARRYGERTVVLFIDVDGFKAINDAHGHQTGDEALKAIAVALTNRVRETDLVARIGGDEFAVLLPHTDAERGAAIAEDLRGVIGACKLADRDHVQVRLNASVGMGHIDSDTSSDDEVLAEADKAMYQDKAQPKPSATLAGVAPAGAREGSPRPSFLCQAVQYPDG